MTDIQKEINVVWEALTSTDYKPWKRALKALSTIESYIKRVEEKDSK
jgi:hypothetical protein